MLCLYGARFMDLRQILLHGLLKAHRASLAGPALGAIVYTLHLGGLCATGELEKDLIGLRRKEMEQGWAPGWLVGAVFKGRHL